MKIAILLLNNNGDILYATSIARQIKEHDFPGCHLTWIVARQCSDILKNNPYIDRLEIVTLDSLRDIYSGKWKEIESLYKSKQRAGEYDKLFVLQPFDKNFLLYKSCIRQMILDAYPLPVRGSLKSVIALSDTEKNNVRRFMDSNKIEAYHNRIIFEFAPSSGQSTISVSEAIHLAERIAEENPSTCVILSSGLELELNNPHVFSARALSFKENAELINHCTLLLGCSSGISWLSTSGYCKTLPTIQFLNEKAPWFNSLKADFRINHFDAGHIVELYRFTGDLIAEAVGYSIRKGMAQTKQQYDQPLKDRYLLNNFISISEAFYWTGAFRNQTVFFLKNITRGLPFVKCNLLLFYSLCVRRVRRSLGFLKRTLFTPN